MNIADLPDLTIATAERLCPVEIFHEPVLVRLLQVAFFQLHDQVDPMGEADGPQVRTANCISERKNAPEVEQLRFDNIWSVFHR